MKIAAKLLMLFVLAGALAGCGDTQEAEVQAERPQLYVSSSWMRQPIAGRDMSSAYVNLTNSGTADDVLLSARSDMAARVEIHQTMTENGIASMNKMDALPIPMDVGLAMAPGGAHLMLFGLKKNFQAGEEIYISLSFEESEPITFKVPILKTAPRQD